MMPSFAEADRLLRDRGAPMVRHSGRTLYQHLQGTYSLLKKAGEPEEVCLAGFYHSVYGTNVFRRVLIDRRERATVRVAIGEAAEELVYLFCSIDRPRCLSERGDLKPEIYRDLLAIEIANLVEQGSSRWIPHLKACLSSVQERLP
jgi:hypothetical protein